MHTLCTQAPLPWRIIDGIGPFFRDVRTKRVNWSKVPFADWEVNGQFCPKRAAQVLEDARRLMACVAAEGYNAVTFDDLAHLAQWEGYPSALQSKIEQYRQLYRSIFKLAADMGLRPLLTTDVVSCAVGRRCEVGAGAYAAIAWLAARVDATLQDFPDLGGMILRIGECDEERTRGDFRSLLAIRTPRQARLLLQTLLPVFARHQRMLILRLWTVGAFPIGDLMWNPRTFRHVFEDIDSPWLMLSLKHGESDFFRHLPVNPLFFRSRHAKIVEFQARREYEGFGEYPSFAGIQAEDTLHALEDSTNVCGISVWCQTGGWGRFKRLTYLRDSSPWVELNVAVLAALAQGMSWEDAASRWLKRTCPQAEVSAFPAFLRKADRVIEQLLYVRAYGRQPLYFRRTRLPPLLHVYWDRILLHPLLRVLLRRLVCDRKQALCEGRSAFEALEAMCDLAQRRHLPDLGLAFQRDTFRILLAVRAYYLGDTPVADLERIRELKRNYKHNWSQRYSIRMPPKERPWLNGSVSCLLRLFCRRSPPYRLVDHLITLHVLSLLRRLLRRFNARLFPGFARKRAMGVDSLFR